MQIAAQEEIEDDVRRGLRSMMVASVGPTTSETLAELGIAVDFEPSHPKMGFLLSEGARAAGEILRAKRERKQ
jgi:uroporphyrinogen-III synthase